MHPAANKGLIPKTKHLRDTVLNTLSIMSWVAAQLPLPRHPSNAHYSSGPDQYRTTSWRKLHRVNLRNADLSGAHLSSADMGNTKLHPTNLSYAEVRVGA